MEELTRTSGVYMIKNLKNEKLYIGQSKNIPERWKSHVRTAYNKKQKSYKYQLYREIRYYGIENFQFLVLERCEISIG
jgi:group I intron endonuclease